MVMVVVECVVVVVVVVVVLLVVVELTVLVVISESLWMGVLIAHLYFCPVFALPSPPLLKQAPLP